MPSPDGKVVLCRHRQLLDTDEDWPTGPICGEPASHWSCAGAHPVCAMHKCRCNVLLPRSRRDRRSLVRAAPEPQGDPHA